VPLELAPCTLAEANRFVETHHRHHAPTPVAQWCHAATLDGRVVGVAIVGQPKARMACDGWTVEVTRVATDGTRNACSLLYGAARRAAFALGYTRVLTYVLEAEDGASLRAAGYRLDGVVRGESWKRKHATDNYAANDLNPIGDKRRYLAGEKREAERPVVAPLPVGGLLEGWG
jgi:hypothetical protein